MVKAFLVSGEYRERFGGSPSGNQDPHKEPEEVGLVRGFFRELVRETAMHFFAFSSTA